MAIRGQSALDSVLERGIAHPEGVRSNGKLLKMVNGELIPWVEGQTKVVQVTESIVESKIKKVTELPMVPENMYDPIVPVPAAAGKVTERKQIPVPESLAEIIPVLEFDNLDKRARYNLLHAEEIKARDRERKAAKKAARVAKL